MTSELATALEKVSVDEVPAVAPAVTAVAQEAAAATRPSPRITFADAPTTILPREDDFPSSPAHGYLGPDNHNGELQVTLRILISTKEAGVIIGKEGKQVADIRSAASVRAGVSKAVPNINDRIFTVTGPIENVAHAYAFVAQALIDNPITSSPPLLHAYAQHHPITTASLRLLVAHNLMGTIIGKGGAKIKQIQDMSGARVIATKEMLPQSTERIIEIHGTSDCVSKAVEEVAKCIVEDYERGIGTVMYNPNGRIPLVSMNMNPYVSGFRPAHLEQQQQNQQNQIYPQKQNSSSTHVDSGNPSPITHPASLSSSALGSTSSAAGAANNNSAPSISASVGHRRAYSLSHQKMLAEMARRNESTDSLNGGSHAHPLPSSSTSALHTTLAGVRPSVHFGSDVKPAGTPPTTLRHPTDAVANSHSRTRSLSTTLASSPYGNVVGAMNASSSALGGVPSPAVATLSGHHGSHSRSASRTISGGSALAGLPIPPALPSAATLQIPPLTQATLPPSAIAAAASMTAFAQPPVTEIRTQEISIPGDMVGCIIGKGGQRIAEIRRQSGARITIARLANDEKGERLFTIQGSPESNERALFLLYNQLDIERTRRLQHAAQQAAAQAQGAPGLAPVAIAADADGAASADA